MLWWAVDGVMAVVIIPTVFFFALRLVHRTMELDKGADQVVERRARRAADARAPANRRSCQAGGSDSAPVRPVAGRIGASAMAEHPELN